MKPRTPLLLSSVSLACVLLAVAGNLLGQADEPPQLPAQYAEVVLQVDGMI